MSDDDEARDPADDDSARLLARLAELNTREPDDATAADDPAMDTIVETALAELRAARGLSGERWPRRTGPGVGASWDDRGMTDTANLPHDDYAASVVEALTAIGVTPDQWWTETPNGQQLDAVFTFGTNADIRQEWPDGVFLGWDQRQGWSLVDESTNRALFPLGLGTYAAPAAVATRTKTILFSAGSTPVDEAWDGAAALEEAVKAWETA